MGSNISIIIPVYNGENSICRPLESIRKQIYRHFEVIVIDDGSIDGTAKAVHHYSSIDSRYNYTYQRNKGVAAARNKGLEIAKGEFICFLDSDDYYQDDFLEKMHSQIEAAKNDVCYCGYNIITPNKTVKRRTNFKVGDILLDYILEKVNVHTSGWMIKRKIVDINGIKFNEGVSWGEDFEFFCEVLARTQLVTCVSEYLTNYRSGFGKNQLSAFSVEKLNQDFNSITRIQNNPVINKNDLINNALINYRLPALLTYRLLEAKKIDHNKEALNAYFHKYRNYYSKLSWNNGLRSIKLNLHRIKLMHSIRRNMH